MSAPSARLLLASHAVGTGQALTNAYGTALQLGSVTTEGFNPFPTTGLVVGMFLDHIEIEVNTIAGGATSITGFLSWDAAGDRIAMPEVTGTLTVGKTTATSGGTFYAVDAELIPPPGEYTAGKLYLWLKTNAGTCNARALAHGRA